MRGLAEDCSIVIKPADKGSYVVVWDRTDYLLEAEKHLSDANTYEEVTFGDTELVKLLEERNRTFRRLLSKKCISPQECKYFSYHFKKSTNLAKLYFLHKFTKDCIMKQVALSFLIMAHPQKKSQNIWITT